MTGSLTHTRARHDFSPESAENAKHISHADLWKLEAMHDSTGAFCGCERELCVYVFTAALPLPYCETCGPSDITAHSPSKRQSSIETRAFISTPTTTQNKYINICARCSRGKTRLEYTYIQYCEAATALE